MATFLALLGKDYCGECPCTGDPQTCVCLESEAVLRCYASGWPRTAMTPAQREACLEEIAQVEGYDRRDYENASDQDLARGVLQAWTDYCRDKGLL